MTWVSNIRVGGKNYLDIYFLFTKSVSNLISFTRYSIDICLLSCKSYNICNYFLPLKLCSVYSFVINNIQFLVLSGGVRSTCCDLAWAWRTEGYSEWPTEFWHLSLWLWHYIDNPLENNAVIHSGGHWPCIPSIHIIEEVSFWRVK